MRLAKEAQRQVEDEAFRLQQEEHIAKLRDVDDLDEIIDGKEQSDLLVDNEEEMTEQQFDKMMDMWKQEASQGGMKDMMSEWNKVWEEDA